MPRNGSGTYTLPAGNPVVTGTTISSTWANNTLSDIGTSLTNSIAKDGQTTPTANLPMGGFKHTGVAVAAATTDYARADQVQNGSLVYLTSVSGADTITATAAISLSAYAVGQKFHFVSAGANTGAVTINVNGIGAKAVTKNGATALVSGEIASGAACEVVYDGTQFQLVSLTKIGTSANNVVQLNGSAQIPAVDGSLLTYLKVFPYVRQTVLSGPVDSGGLPNFGGSTGSATVTATGSTLLATAATGNYDYMGSITSPSWTGLSTNGTMFLYLEIDSAGVVTTGSTTLVPVYQFGGTYSTTSGQHTFNIQEMTMKVGNGSVATQVYRVFVGEVTVSGNVVTAITWYALMGRYYSGYTNTLPGGATSVSKNHNIGTTLIKTGFRVKNLTSEASYVAGDVEPAPWRQSGTSNSSVIVPVVRSRLSMQASTGNTLAIGGFDPTNGGAFLMTAARWAYELWAERSW